MGLQAFAIKMVDILSLSLDSKLTSLHLEVALFVDAKGVAD